MSVTREEKAVIVRRALAVSRHWAEELSGIDVLAMWRCGEPCADPAHTEGDCGG